MKLSQCESGTRVLVQEINIDHSFMLRVQELGLRTGVELTIGRRVPPNGLVVNVGGARIAVDERSAQRIEVVQVKP